MSEWCMGTKSVLLVGIEPAPGKGLESEPTKNGTRGENTLVLTFKRHPQPYVDEGKAQLPLVFQPTAKSG